MTWIQQTTTSK